MRSTDEYVDYSCSTPLEILSRDVETLLRKWHVIQGSDRHVSFHSSQSQRGSATPSRRSYQQSPQQQQQPSPSMHSLKQPRSHPTPTRPRTDNMKQDASTSATASPSHTPSRGALKQIVGNSPFRTPERPSSPRGLRNESSHASGSGVKSPAASASKATNNTSCSDIRLIRSAKVTFSTLPPTSSNHVDRMDIELELCLWDGPPSSDDTHLRRKRGGSGTTGLGGSSVPLSLVSHRHSPFPSSNLLSNLSTLLGIGQHITLTPCSTETIESVLQETMDALVVAQHPSSIQRHKEIFRQAQQASSLLASTLFASSTYSLASSAATIAEKVSSDVSLHSTALQSLGGQLQMALNTAASNCDCRIPVFGIWGLYRQEQQGHAMGGRSGSLHRGRTPSEQFQRGGETTLSQSILDVPAYLNGGDLIHLAAESSLCCIFMKHFKSLRGNAQENEAELLNSVAGTNVSGDEFKEDGGGDNTKVSTPSRSSRSTTATNSIMTPKSPLSNSTPHAVLPPTPLRARLLASSTRPREVNSKGSEQLFLPPFIVGSCQPGSSLFGTSAAFAIHVVPPGLSYPVHCTTLNSLGQLLLQHCQPPSLNHRKRRNEKWVGGGASGAAAAAAGGGKNPHGNIVVSGARHKYTWCKIFEYSHESIPGQEGLLSTPRAPRHIAEWADFDILTCGLSWRKSCSGDARTQFQEKSLGILASYGRECQTQALKMMYRVSCVSKSRRSKKALLRKKGLEPLWGPIDDPLLQVSVLVTWAGGKELASTVTPKKKKVIAPLLTLPLRIRSNNTMSSQDVLEMENTLLGTIFNPVSVPETDFSTSVSYDSHAACTTLSANNRCLLAALIRASTLETDALLAHLTKSTVLEELHDMRDLDNAAIDLMDKSKIFGITRKIVEVMDWAGMADTADDDEMENGERLKDIVLQVLDGTIMRSFTEPPDDIISMLNDKSLREMVKPSGIMDSMFNHSLSKAAPPGRLLSVLFSSMGSLQTPAAIAALWMEFVAELRLRWEARQSLPNLGPVPGLDAIGKLAERKSSPEEDKTNFGDLATGAAFVNCSEPDPDISQCLINQQLQVYNIGVETMIAKVIIDHERQERERGKHETDKSGINDTSLLSDIEVKIGDESTADGEIETELKDKEEERGTLVLPTSIGGTSGDGASSALSYGDEYDESSSDDSDLSLSSTSHGPQIILNEGILNDFDVMSTSTRTTDYEDALTSADTATIASCYSSYFASEGSGEGDIVIEDFMGDEQVAAHVAQRQTRHGARCPVFGLTLIASGDQLYAPYVQRTAPLTAEVLLERRRMLEAKEENISDAVKSRIDAAHRLQKSKLRSDMSAFKAANPGAVFQDFISWYGNPSNPLQQYEDDASVKTKSAMEEAQEALLVLDATRTFWSETWEEAEACPASNQDPLFDAYSTVEMLLHSFESMHPALLMNQVLAVNLAMAYFILQSSKPPCRISYLDDAFWSLEKKIEEALALLEIDLKTGLSKSSGDKKSSTGSYSHASPSTLLACENVCDKIGEVELLLSRATSLLTKFSGDSIIVEEILGSNESQYLEVESYESRTGILNAINLQQDRNSGKNNSNMNDFPYASVREYILRNRNDSNPCQLTVCIGGTHGLENGGNNSTKGGLVLALNKSVIQ